MAKANNIRTNLGYLGEAFQFQLVKYFIETPKFFAKLVTIVDQNMFTDEHLRRIVGLMKDRYNKFGSCPNYNDIEIMLRTTVTDQITLELMLEKLKKIASIRFEIGVDLITTNAEKFFKQQNLAKAINQCQEILKRGNIDEYYAMEDLINKAINTNLITDMGWRLFDTLEDDLKEDYRLTIPTGADKLDESLFGGLGKGELGVIVSPMGVGKTSCTTGFAANAACTKSEQNNYNGYKVLHFYFEDEDVNIRRKYYGYITNIDSCELSTPENKPLVMQILTDNNNELRCMLRDNIRGQHLATGEYSASDIKYLIQQHISTGFVPDLVIVDYFECLKPERNTDGISDSEWSREGVTMRKLETIAHEFNVALWVPVQSTKEAIGQEYVGLAHAGGSVKKTQIGHVVIQLAQTKEQKEQSRFNMFIGKLRAVKIGRTSFPNIKFNNGTCKFDMSDLDSYDAEPLAMQVQQNNQFRQNAVSMARAIK